ncbi:MAG: ABC transporter ATP-binding protein [Chloroflexi bacterium]|nr:ABC transporter ATP-binding protein [Chloroflexota bacterium]
MGFHGGGNWRAYIRYDEERDQPEVSRALLRRVATYAQPYWGRAAMMIGLIILTSLLNLVSPLLYRDLLDNALPNRDTARLNLLALGVIGIPVLTGLIGVAQRYFSASIGEGIIHNLRRSLYDHMQRMSLRFFTNTRTGEMMSRLNNDVIGAQRAVTGTLVNIIVNVISLISTLTIMISLEWRLTLLGVAILPLFILPARRVGRVLRRIARQSMEYNAQMNAMMNETLNVSGALLVKIFGRGPDEVAKFSERAGQVRDIGVRQSLIGRWFFMGLGLAGALGTALVFWLGGHLVLRGAFTIGTIIAFGTYLTQLYGPLTALTNARVEFATSMVSFERVFEVLDLPIEIEDCPRAKSLGRAKGHVRFEQVSFSYTSDDESNGAATTGLEDVPRFGWGRHATSVLPSDQRGKKESTQDGKVIHWAVRDVSFEIQPGQLVAMVGPSGAGKTTVTYLLPRLYDPTEGRITFDGHDLCNVTLDSLSANIGMVTQETYLFHDTIRVNLHYAKPDATQAELEAACRTANIHDFIASLPDGYDTVVGERGYRLSGGEKQRVAIARVILKDPRVLILDEATSHLDSQSEALIQQALERVMEGRTSLVIAHRLSTILSADLILVIDNGQLVEQGTHAELMAQEGVYAGLYHTQFQSEAESA